MAFFFGFGAFGGCGVWDSEFCMAKKKFLEMAQASMLQQAGLFGIQNSDSQISYAILEALGPPNQESKPIFGVSGSSSMGRGQNQKIDDFKVA